MSWENLEAEVAETFGDAAQLELFTSGLRVIAPLRDGHRHGYYRDYYRRNRARLIRRAVKYRLEHRRPPGVPGPSGRVRMVAKQADNWIIGLARARARTRRSARCAA